jgi:hypothetical protein
MNENHKVRAEIFETLLNDLKGGGFGWKLKPEKLNFIFVTLEFSDNTLKRQTFRFSSANNIDYESTIKYKSVL